VVDPGHVDALLSVALHGPADFEPLRYPGWQPPEVGMLLGGAPAPLCASNAPAIGASLLAECIASVSHSHPTGPEDLPGANPIPLPEHYEFTDFGRVLSAPEACKAIACLECQSSEHPGWPGSAARAFLGDLLWRLITTLPGYERAPWELSTDLLLARTGAAPAVLA
jgi:hypothetical protein